MIQKWEITSGREMIEKERKRLLKLKETDKEWWNSPRSTWAREQFGENLVEKDGTVYALGEVFDEHRCSICDRIPDIDEKILSLEFSFCDEYDCGMNICKDCLKRFMKAFEEGDKNDI